MAYKAPVRDLTFVLNEVLEIDRYSNQPGFAEVSSDLVQQILEEGAKFAEEVIAPLNKVGDQEGCKWDNGKVTGPTGWKEAYQQMVEAGANIVSGPSLSMTDPEATANLAYADAYKAARKRAEAYAEAAGMEVSRVLYIRDAGGTQGQTWLRGADAMAESVAVRTQNAAPPPPPLAMPAPEQGSPSMMVGTTRSDVYIQVDFALREK